MVNWKQDLVLSIVLLFVAMAFYLPGRDYPGTVAHFSSYLSEILGILAVCLAISACRRRSPGAYIINHQASRGPVLITLLTIAFIYLLPVLGFIPSCFLLAASIYLSLGYPQKITAILVALAASVIIYLVFHTALEVPLPLGSLWTDA